MNRPDTHDNYLATEGCTRCTCGNKYWEHDRCVDCGALPPLTAAHVAQLSAIAHSMGKPVSWLVDDDGSAVISGTARHVIAGPDDFGFLTEDDDVRAGFLRITAVFDYTIPMRRVMHLVAIGGYGEA